MPRAMFPPSLQTPTAPLYIYKSWEGVKSSGSDPDPFGSVSFWSAGSVLMKRIWIAKNLWKSWKISTKINQNHKNIIHFFKNIKLMFNGLKCLPHNIKTDNFWGKYIFDSKKVVIFFDFRSDMVQDPLFLETNPRIQIQIKMKRIRTTGQQDFFYMSKRFFYVSEISTVNWLNTDCRF